MSKAILIIDKPERSCIMCPCYELESGTCQALPNDEPWDHYDINDNHIIPKDCPLKPYDEAIPNIYFETTTTEIPMTWIKAYTRTEISNADFWAITRMVTKWEEGKELREGTKRRN